MKIIVLKKNAELLKKITAALSVLLIFALFSTVYNPKKTLSAFKNVKLKPSVVLDAGHGGFDGGAVSCFGEVEKDINLSITKKCHDFLKIFGFGVIMTRTDDSALSNTKKGDMYKRLEIVKANQDALFLSIHQNFYEQPQYYGAQMFYGEKNAQSKRLATILKDNFKQNLAPENKREIKKADSDLYLYKNAPSPCVLIECGFLSNPNEARLLINEDYQKEIAFTILQSVCEFVK